MTSQAMVAPEALTEGLMTQSDTSNRAAALAGAPTKEDADLISRNLRSLFRSVEQEPLPENLQALLAKLGETEGRS